ncbi:MAG: YaaA family protein [Patescibacteria group bacterium]
MLILTSPAKTLDFESKWNQTIISQPQYLLEAADLIKRLRLVSKEDLMTKMKVSDTIAALNKERFNNWTMNHTTKNARPAILAYSGDIYRQLEPQNYPPKKQKYLQDTVRIISGLYGLLRPYDLIQPYRLEMSSQVMDGVNKKLYSFWGDKITQTINEEIDYNNHTFVLNLASKEYADVVQKQSLRAPVLTIEFRQRKDGQLVNQGLLAKRARGMMIHYTIEHLVSDRKDLRAFSYDGYILEDETKDSMTYIKSIS